jgi:hypothetical protein
MDDFTAFNYLFYNFCPGDIYDEKNCSALWVIVFVLLLFYLGKSIKHFREYNYLGFIGCCGCEGQNVEIKP